MSVSISTKTASVPDPSSLFALDSPASAKDIPAPQPQRARQASVQSTSSLSTSWNSQTSAGQLRRDSIYPTGSPAPTTDSFARSLPAHGGSNPLKMWSATLNSALPSGTNGNAVGKSDQKATTRDETKRLYSWVSGLVFRSEASYD